MVHINGLSPLLIEMQSIRLPLASPMTQRRNSQEPPEHGGWNAHCTYTVGFDLLTPGTNLSLNAIGRAGFVGWPTNAKLTTLRNQWLDAGDLSEQQRICREIQAEFWKDPPYFPLGQFFQATAYRNTISQIPRGSFSLFWNLRKT